MIWTSGPTVSRTARTISSELEIVRETHEGLRVQTGSLVNALRGEPHTRGRWGEIQLRRVIEMAGMLSYCDFEEQPSVDGDEGRRLRPDVIVRLPGGKSIVIDSKVSLVGYLKAYREGATDDERRAGLSDHARQVRDHIGRLGQKAYWRQLPDTPEFVVMFLHDETSWRSALEADPTLDELALSNNEAVRSAFTTSSQSSAVAVKSPAFWQASARQTRSKAFGYSSAPRMLAFPAIRHSASPSRATRNTRL